VDLDNLTNSSLEFLRRVSTITGVKLSFSAQVDARPARDTWLEYRFVFFEGDIRNEELLKSILISFTLRR